MKAGTKKVSLEMRLTLGLKATCLRLPPSPISTKSRPSVPRARLILRRLQDKGARRAADGAGAAEVGSAGLSDREMSR